VFAVANHVANFADNVTMLTAIGADDGSVELVSPKLNPQIKCHYVEIKGAKTLSKKRYVLRDGNTLSKLFETYSGADNLIGRPDAIKVCNFIREHGDEFDMILVSDFGNGFINSEIIQALAETKSFLAVNVQINSGNRGYNVVTHYPRADYISLNEGELRLTAHDKHGELKLIVERVCANLSCKDMAVTRGVHGVLVYSREHGYLEIPALTQQAIDRVGAGDCYLAISSLCLANRVPFDVAAFIGSAAAAVDVQIVGNKESVGKVALSKYLNTLMMG
jgi:bifunctional ADP-heptose synthase (sugar kinase/adenylyltransferase)